MQLTAIFTALAAILPLTKAQTYTGLFAIGNHCGSPIYMWTIADQVSDRITLLNSDPEYIHRNTMKSDGGGVAIAISKDPNGLYNGAPRLILAYTLDMRGPPGSGTIWYELNTENGSPFEGEKLLLAGDACPSIEWDDGKEPETQVLKYCNPVGVNMWLALCSSL
ncbi:hypothetical protein M011DRAFT_465541 [Sporormia fimetaria CBS 119925]|uniref:BYS1 domain protein n=1 Tax=Sporormia fimetaria CBS 119925 TaxID=1340428 RepID=A0A6A6VIB3_9PLEO|nr:hypothetical protein M011DRAFT_465541 [Sporormia fimetaria CBS 119925]